MEVVTPKDWSIKDKLKSPSYTDNSGMHRVDRRVPIEALEAIQHIEELLASREATGIAAIIPLKDGRHIQVIASSAFDQNFWAAGALEKLKLAAITLQDVDND